MTVEEIFEKCKKITHAKREDYTIGSDRNENFHRSAMIISWFAKDRDRPYAALIGTKMSRLGSLLSKNSKPNFESIEDNFADIINYFALWLEDITEQEKKLPAQIVPGTVILTPQVQMEITCWVCRFFVDTVKEKYRINRRANVYIHEVCYQKLNGNEQAMFNNL